MEAREISVAFAEAFCSGDLERLASFLTADFQLRGPLFTFDSREAYLQSLREDPPERGGCRVLHATGNGEDAAVLYEYRKASSTVLVAQFSRLSGGLITEVRLVFDTADVSEPR